MAPTRTAPAGTQDRTGGTGLLDAPRGRPGPETAAMIDEAQREFFAHTPRSFAEPGTAEGRIGVVDAGSNSVRLVVFEGAERSPAVLHNEKVMCALGLSLAETGRLNPKGRERALAALRRFAAIAEHMKVATLAGVATAAIRDAADGPAFVDEVARTTGIRLHVAAGTGEARLSAQGVLFGEPQAEGVVVDLGGASMELCPVGDGRPGQGISTPLGPLRLSALADPDAEIARHLAALPPAIRAASARLYLVGGSWRALARAQMERSAYPLKVLHEYTLDAEIAADLARWVRRMPPEELAQIDGVSDGRAGLLPMAGRLLRGLLDALQPAEVVISAFGLREGVCYEAMPRALRRRDPLLCACEAQERLFARAPGFGAELGEWLTGFLAPVDAAEARLMRAVSHLADVNWRAHPDHRVEGAWETVTRVTLTDLGHRGRIVMGLALAARHKMPKRGLANAPGAALLSEAAQARALAIGLALRLGSTIAASAPGVLPLATMSDDGRRLALRLTGTAREMAGEEVDKRLSQLAKHLGRGAEIETIGEG